MLEQIDELVSFEILAVLGGAAVLILIVLVALKKKKDAEESRQINEQAKKELKAPPTQELGQKRSATAIDIVSQVSEARKAEKQKAEEPVDTEEIPVPPKLKVVPKKKPSNFSKAISSWIPLLKEKTKDRDRWEEVLIMSDMGPRLADELLDGLEKTEEAPMEYFKVSLKNVLKPAKAQTEPWADKKPWVLFVVGVNGVGKTTTVVKLGRYLHGLGKSVGVVGADTFRKAAIEQLERGCQKNDLSFFTHKKNEEMSEGADPSAVIFDGLKEFKDKDVILVDTSGRLHTKKNLMEELKKMKRVGDKSLPGAPHDIWLVLDATLGQNALSQAQVFHEAVDLSGLILTKMDGLSRGGSVFQLYRELQRPIWFLGKGEDSSDLESFDPDNFVEELFDLSAS